MVCITGVWAGKGVGTQVFDESFIGCFDSALKPSSRQLIDVPPP